MKNENLKFGFVAMVFCIGFTTFSNAQPQQKERPTFEQLVEKLDSNKDGKIAESEVKGPLKNNFSEIDTNKDGFISEAEFNNAPKKRKSKSE
jgi:Ca2+-binding EF-hand superfamily protein